MTTLIENPYSLLIALSAKIIYDYKIKESDWPAVIVFVKQHVKSNVKNEAYAYKLISTQIAEVDAHCIKNFKNDFKCEIDDRKCYFKLIDWIVQISLTRKRLARAIQKKTVAKHIINEELAEANKHFSNQGMIKSVNVDKIIEISLQAYIK